MPLLEFWKTSPQAVSELSVEQVVASAGDGILKDHSSCSEEFRTYLSQVATERLGIYIAYCLKVPFARSGLVLQDLINELGRRLDYEVKNGIYQGTSKQIGFDGLWRSPEGHTIIVEVKTTDAYRISLDTLVGYQKKVTEQLDEVRSVSLLITVGREDTGELEAQVRGSRHAWDIRLISTDSLIKVVELKENAEEPDTGKKIREILRPMEYTRLDNVIDIVFAAAKDVEKATASESVQSADGEDESSPPMPAAKGSWNFTDNNLLQEKRQEIVTALGRNQGVAFIKNSRALYWNASHESRIACTMSKRYEKSGAYPYWYAYHPQWAAFLQQAVSGYLVLGLMDRPFAFALPFTILQDNIDALNTTTVKELKTYWHINLIEQRPQEFAMLLPKWSDTLSLESYKFSF